MAKTLAQLSPEEVAEAEVLIGKLIAAQEKLWQTAGELERLLDVDQIDTTADLGNTTLESLMGEDSDDDEDAMTLEDVIEHGIPVTYDCEANLEKLRAEMEASRCDDCQLTCGQHMHDCPKGGR